MRCVVQGNRGFGTGKNNQVGAPLAQAFTGARSQRVSDAERIAFHRLDRWQHPFVLFLLGAHEDIESSRIQALLKKSSSDGPSGRD